MNEIMLEKGLRAPKRFHNQRARFWFTEAGWNNVGKIVAKRAQAEGFTVKIIKRKNPKSSDVVYRDPLQVAILYD